MAAPTKYKKIFCKRILEFFDVEPFKVVMVEEEEEETGRPIQVPARDKNGNVVLMPAPLPTLEGFAHSIGVHRDSLNEWTRRYPEFSDAIKKAKTLQKNLLIQNGLMGNYDKTFAIFVGKNCLNMSDSGEADYSNVDLSRYKTPAAQASQIIKKAAKGDISLTNATKLVAMISNTVKIDEVTDLRKEVEELKQLVSKHSTE